MSDTKTDRELLAEVLDALESVTEGHQFHGLKVAIFNRLADPPFMIPSLPAQESTDANST